MAPNIGTYALSDAENELAGMGHGTELNQVTNILGVFNRAARRVLGDVDPQETKVVAQMPSPIYNGVYDYPLFIDLKGNKIIDLYPVGNRTLLDNYEQRYNKDFDLWKFYSIQTSLTPKYSGGYRSIKINAPNLVSGLEVNDAAAVNDNGLWVTTQNASNPQQNTIFFTEGAASSLQITLNQVGTTAVGSVINSTMTPQNLTQQYQNNATFFFWVYLPTPSAINSLTFVVGSDYNTNVPTNYFVLSNIATTWTSSSFQTGWNLIAVPWTSMSQVGSPNVANIQYLQVGFNYNGTLQNQILLNQFYCRIGTIFNMEYYSKYLFRNATTNAFQEKALLTTDIVNLDTDGYNLFLYAAFGDICQQVQGLDALFFDANEAETKYENELANYKSKYKSEILKPGGSYYHQPRRGYRGYYGFGMGNGPGSG